MHVNIKRHRIEAETLELLRQAVREYIDSNGFGASDVGGRWRVFGASSDDPQWNVRNMSYNGRFWGTQGREVVL